MSDKLRTLVPIWRPSASKAVRRYNFPDNGGLAFVYGSSIGGEASIVNDTDSNSAFPASSIGITPVKQNNSSCFSSGNDILCALPFLPPNPDACSVNNMLAEQNAGKPLDLRNMKGFINLRTTMIKKQKMLTKLKTIYDELGQNGKVACPIPDFVTDVANKLPDGYLDNKMLLDDLLSTGGGICCLQSMSNTPICNGLLFSYGQHLQSLVYLPTCLDPTSLLLIPDIDSRAVKQFSEKIYQVTTAELDSQLFYGMRTANNLEIGIMTVDCEDKVCFKSICNQTMKSYITDICLSSTIPEYMFITDDGTIKIINLETGSVVGKYCKFGMPSKSCDLEVKQEWSSCRFASNPRCLVCTKRDVLFLTDRRVGCRRTSNLLNAASVSVIHEEKFSCYEKSHSNTHLHYVGSCHSLFLVDERYSNHPVLSWKHQFISPPKYCSSVVWCRQSTSTINEAVILASRRQETAAFHVRHQERDALFSYSVSPTLHIPSPRDIIDILHELGSEITIGTSLLGNLTLHGLCCAITADKRIVVFQQTADGNLYHQPFDYVDHLEDNYKHKGFKPVINYSQADEYLKWLETAFSQMTVKDSLPSTTEKLTVDRKPIYDLLVKLEPHSHGCPFCCHCTNEEIGDLSIDDDDNDVEEVCLNCNMEIHFARTLVDRVHESQVIVGKYPKISVSGSSIPFFAGKIDDHLASANFPTLATTLNAWKHKIENPTEDYVDLEVESSLTTIQNYTSDTSNTPADNSVIYEPVTSQSENSNFAINLDRPFKMFGVSQGFDPVSHSELHDSSYFCGTPILTSDIDKDIIPPTQLVSTSPLTSSVKKMITKKMGKTGLDFDGF